MSQPPPPRKKMARTPLLLMAGKTLGKTQKLK